ncbi:MAG: tripartite tricarboxylate transporter substrate binding protein [Burkholderiales bacterium]
MKTRALLISALCLLDAAWGNALAQSYPTKPIRMLIGFPPGGGTDIIGRIVAQKLGEALGQQIIVDNRGGASGQLAAELVSRANPDGYTIMMAHIAAISILPSLVSKLPYNAQKDFAPVSLSAIGPNLLVVHPSVPAKTVKELVALAKSRPGQLQYASPGAGTVQHLAGELFKLQAKVDMLHVPYKGSGQSIVDLIAGHVHLDFDAVPPVINFVRQGKLRALAVTSAKRFSLLPDMPTVEESGVPGFDMSTWWGIVAPAAVSKDIIIKLNTEMAKAIRQPDAKEKISGVGADIVGNTPEEFAAFIRAETEKYARIVKAANIKID